MRPIDFDNVDAKYEEYVEYMRELAEEEEHKAYQEYLEELSQVEEKSETVGKGGPEDEVLDLCKQFLTAKPEDFQDTPLRGIEGRYFVLKNDDLGQNKIYVAENHIRIYLGDFKSGGKRLDGETLEAFLARIKTDFWDEWEVFIDNTIENLQSEIYFHQDLRRGMHKILGIEDSKDIPF